MGVASLVLGIVGLCISFVPCVGIYALFLTIPGLVLGAVGIKKAKVTQQGKGLSVAGLVLCIIGTLFAILWVCVISGAAAAS